MQSVRRIVAVALALWLAAPQVNAQSLPSAAPGQAQAAIDQALAAQAAVAAADRATIRRVLERSEVRQVAERMGVEIDRLQAGVGMLNATELAEVAEHARTVDQNLAGGATTIVITTTTIIIILLIVILIVLIAD